MHLHLQARELIVTSLPVHDEVMMRMLEALVQVGATAKQKRQLVRQGGTGQEDAGVGWAWLGWWMHFLLLVGTHAAAPAALLSAAAGCFSVRLPALPAPLGMYCFVLS